MAVMNVLERVITGGLIAALTAGFAVFVADQILGRQSLLVTALRVLCAVVASIDFVATALYAIGLWRMRENGQLR